MAAGNLLGIFLGLLLIRRGRIESTSKNDFARAEAALVAICGVLLAAISYWCGMRQFGGYDQSAVIDVAWRLVNGQRPYIDFPCTIPVGFYLGAELAFRVFGVYWRSIIALNSIWTLLSFLWLYALLRTIFLNRLLVFFVVLACVTITLVAVSFWWYNPVTSICASLYAASVFAVILKPRDLARWISLCLTLLLIALMKPNVAGVLILGGSITLFVLRATRLPALVASFVAFLLWLLAIHIHGSSLLQVVTSYLSVASRGMTLHQLLDLSSRGEMIWPERIGEIILLFTLLVPWFAKSSPRPSGSLPVLPIVIFRSCCLLTGLYALISNNELAFVDFPLLLLSASFVVVTRQDEYSRLAVSPGWTRYLTVLCLWLSCMALSEAVVRNRVKAVKDFFEFTETNQSFAVPFFQGLRTGPLFHSEVDYIANLFATQDMSHAFFGNSLGWAYAAFHLQSPKGQPIWWDPGVSFRSADQTVYMDDWVSRKFEPVIILDAFHMGKQVRDTIGRYYVLRSEENFGRKWPCPLHVLVLRNQSTAALPPWNPDL